MPTPETAQRHCDAQGCRRVDVQPGFYQPPGSCRVGPAAFCPRHKPSTKYFTPTPPSAEALREVAAQVHCYCTGRGVDSASGHLHRPQHGCPDVPTPGWEPSFGDRGASIRKARQENADEALLADLFARALHLQLLALDTRANAIGDLHIRPNVCGATIDLTEAEVEAIKRRFRS